MGLLRLKTHRITSCGVVLRSCIYITVRIISYANKFMMGGCDVFEALMAYVLGLMFLYSAPVLFLTILARLICKDIDNWKAWEYTICILPGLCWLVVVEFVPKDGVQLGCLDLVCVALAVSCLMCVRICYGTRRYSLVLAYTVQFLACVVGVCIAFCDFSMKITSFVD